MKNTFDRGRDSFEKGGTLAVEKLRVHLLALRGIQQISNTGFIISVPVVVSSLQNQNLKSLSQTFWWRQAFSIPCHLITVALYM